MNLNPFKSWSDFFAQIIGSMIVFIPLCFWQQWVGRQQVRQEAVDIGVAEWRANNKGAVDFFWRTNQ